MFTGIVEEMGTVRSITRGARSAVIEIGAEAVLEDIHLGDSIAVNGVCLTASAIGSGSFSADVMPETMSRSSLSQLKAGAHVNLERAMAANGRFGGHIVSGHIDGTGRIKGIRRDDNAVWFEIEAPPELMRYIVEKGSVTIDGISLTVARAGERSFSISAIPHTAAVTTLGEKTRGSLVNIENDIIGKYVEKLLQKEKPGSGISAELLARHGFI